MDFIPCITNQPSPSGGYPLIRRGTLLGHLINADPSPPVARLPEADQVADAWQASCPVWLPGLAAHELAHHREDIQAAHDLMEAVLDGEHSLAELLDASRYASRLAPHFDMLGSSKDEGDLQEIETLEFDALEGDAVVAENLWIKASWLSYEEDDPSLRLRFSFGLVGHEDVASDLQRQTEAALLTEAVFPESALISHHAGLRKLLCRALDCRDIAYVERIVYFNAPNGGAQFHQDVERGHLGVVFVQASGSTAWAALSKQQLIEEIQYFLQQPENRPALEALLPDPNQRSLLEKNAEHSEHLASRLDDPDNAVPELLLNRCPAFMAQLAANGHLGILHPGDAVLLPQSDVENCAWHTVFCLGEQAGEGLSFAIRRV